MNYAIFVSELEKVAIDIKKTYENFKSPAIKLLSQQNITKPIKNFNAVQDQGIFKVLNHSKNRGPMGVVKPTMKGGLRDTVVANPSATISKPIK